MVKENIVKTNLIMIDRPSRKCESRFKRDVDTANRKRRRSSGREKVVADKRRLDVDVLDTPSATKVAPISFTPNPTLTPGVQIPSISISPFVIQNAPSVEHTDWDPSPVVGRERAPSTPKPPRPVLWQLSDDDEEITLVTNVEVRCSDVAGLIPLVESEDEEEDATTSRASRAKCQG